MCIQFVYVNNNAGADGYQLIVLNNRDEMYNRPTTPAAFWGPDDTCLSGLDKMMGRKGGTWFGASRAGKVAALLNIRTPSGPLPEKRGRGPLVTEFLKHPTGAATYLSQVELEAESFNPFNLILIEKGDDGWKVYYYSNSNDFENHTSVVLKDGIHGFSNSVSSRPFNKVRRGESALRQVLQQYGRVDHKVHLHQALFDIMADATCTVPDPQLLLQGGPGCSERLTEQLSGIYVDASDIGYGTRTTTLLTVTANGNTDYIEKTMREPIDSLNPIWDTVSYNFQQQAPKAECIRHSLTNGV